MSDLLDKGEQEMQQLVTRVSMKAGEAGFKASLQLTKHMTLAPFQAATAIFTAVSEKLHKSKTSSEMSLKAFSQAVEGKREVLNIDDAKVSKEFERELNKHGVLWSVERHPDGTQTFHIQGKDAELVQHALGAAAQRVDEKLALNAPELQADRPAPQQMQEQAQSTQQRQPEEAATREVPVQEAETQRLDLPEQQAAHTPDQIAPHGNDELREDTPAHQAAERDHGGRSAEREPALSRHERDPKLTPIDSTRTQVKAEITKRVDAEKTRTATKKNTRERSKQQSHSRSDDATAPKTTRR